MVNSPVLSAPMRRTLPGAAEASGSVKASHGWGAFGPYEVADQAQSNYYQGLPSEGADQ